MHVKSKLYNTVYFQEYINQEYVTPYIYALKCAVVIYICCMRLYAYI